MARDGAAARRGCRTSRRRFIGSSVGLAGFLIVPRHVLGAGGGTPPSEKLNIACIGVGGMGQEDVNSLTQEQVVALCDVDQRRGAASFSKYPQAKRYSDFRIMLEEMDRSIDAVTVSTPDHTHAVAAMAAIRRGKHVYCQKPLAHSIYEVRELVRVAKEKKVVTQLGNQGHSSETIRMFCEWIWDGAIGTVYTIHAGCASVYSRIGQLEQVKRGEPVPPTLNWDLWLGPAQYRPYHRAYVPGSWRGWMPFGTGVIGDWVCHVVDPVFWALDLGWPTSIRAQAQGYDPEAHADTFPRGTIVRFEFPAKGQRGPVTLWWHDGQEKLPRPAELEEGRSVPDTGAVVLGDKGGITYGSHGAGGLRIFPETKMRAYKLPPKTIPRAREHHQDWLDAIRRGRQAGSDFSYGGPLTEIALLGIIAIRLLGQELKWDGANMRFTNSEQANRLLKPEFRQGWSL